MTNYEWLIENNEVLIKDILAQHFNKEKGIFYSTEAAKEWLEDAHEPLYKKGDVVVDHNNVIRIIKEDYYDGDFIMVSRYIDDTGTIEEPITSIKKKVGHVQEMKG